MKIAMIHNGKRVDDKTKEVVVSKIKMYDETSVPRIRTAPVDFLRQLYEDLPQGSEKVQLIFFLDVRSDLMAEALQNMPTLPYPVYVVKVGNKIESANANESVNLIEDWDPKGFLEFIKFKFVEHS